MIEWLTDPLAYAFMQRGLLAALMVGVLCAVIGCYVVLRSMAFLGDAMAHAVLPGIAIAYLLSANLTRRRADCGDHRRSRHQPADPPGRGQGGHGDRHSVHRGAGVGRGVDQQHPHLRRRPQPHPLRQRAGRQPGDLWLTAGVGLLVFTVMAPLLPPLPADLVRSCVGSHAATAGGVLPHVAAGPAGADHRRLDPDRGGGAGRGHAGDARRDGLSADAAAAVHDGAVWCDWRGLCRAWPVRQLLPEHRIGCSRRV